MPSAGEVEQFAYCAHNWLLARRGVEGPKSLSDPGIAEHKRIGLEQQKVEERKQNYRETLAWSFRIVVVALSAVLVALAVRTSSTRQNPVTVSLIIVSLLLLLVSSGFLTMAIIAQNRYKAWQLKTGLVPGRLLQTDLVGQAPLMSDPEWGLSGRPDYLLQTNHGPIPVEVKTGRTPEHPRHSHVFQLATYLRLLEASTGKPPEYGLVTYPQGTFRIDWDPALRTKLREMVGRMKEAELDGKADRDHDIVGRCRGCARRDACDQKLV